MKKTILVMLSGFLSAVIFISNSYAKDKGGHRSNSYNRHGSYEHVNGKGHKRSYSHSSRGRFLGSSGFHFGFTTGSLGIFVNTGRRSCRPKPFCPPRPCPPRPCPPCPIIRMIEDDYRLYQPRVHGHPAFLQRWSSYENRWVTVKMHPSIY